jgi:hypothetical protein
MGHHWSTHRPTIGPLINPLLAHSTHHKDAVFYKCLCKMGLYRRWNQLIGIVNWCIGLHPSARVLKPWANNHPHGADNRNENSRLIVWVYKNYNSGRLGMVVLCQIQPPTVDTAQVPY